MGHRKLLIFAALSLSVLVVDEASAAADPAAPVADERLSLTAALPMTLLASTEEHVQSAALCLAEVPDSGGQVVLRRCGDNEPLCWDSHHQVIQACAVVQDHDHERGLRIGRILFANGWDAVSTIVAHEENPGVYEANPLLKTPLRVMGTKFAVSGLEIILTEKMAARGPAGRKSANRAAKALEVLHVLVGIYNFKNAFQ
jgi:hypothetical protein